MIGAVRRRWERFRRGRFLRRAGRLTRYVAADAEAGSLIVSTHDRGIGRRLFVQRAYGADELTEAMTILVEAGMRSDLEETVFVDVGANIGSVVLSAVQRWGFGSAVAVEPEPDNCRVLRANLALNAIDDRVEVLPVAVSERLGPAYLGRSAGKSGGHRLQARPGPGSVRVEATTLDRAVRGAGVRPANVGLVYVDAQGHEARILAGARRMMRAGVPMVIEYAPRLLRKAGADDLDRLEDTAQAMYTDFADLRDRDGDDSRSVLRPVSELPLLRDRYDTASGGRGFTDLLLIRR